ncbi:hypothetical protein Q8F55_005337 [Vanrija albida]|uniref:Inner centromere protein ARK-binding domain-containing protein n=1 Tax=Vanrija albida TaxID=181172 RepID=A0ABR3Q1C1_9TREE
MSATTWPTFQDFTFDLSDRLRQAAQRSLAELEASINCDGHDWLEDYIDNIEAQGRKAPIADLIKTPSRTQTAKKTRAVLTASKNRVEQIRLFNERAALSPLASNSPNVRQPFSPLSTHRLNTIPASPTPASPLKGKVLPLTKAKKEKVVKEKVVKPPKAKKGKKQNPDEATSSKENAMEVEPTASSSTKSTGIRGVAPQAPAVTVEAPPTKAAKVKVTRKPTPPKAKEPTPEPQPEQEELEEDVMEVDPVAVVEAPVVVGAEPAEEPIDVDEDEQEPIDVDEPEQEPVAPVEAVDVEAEVEEEIEEEAEEEVEEEVEEDADFQPVAVAAHEPIAPVAAEPAPSTSPIKAVSPVKTVINETSPFKVAPAETASVKHSSPEKASSPIKEAVAAAPAVPVRQVRSSWLSSALGTRTVPVSGLGADRKSHASGSQPRGSIQYESLRKSVAAAGTLKRKSEDGPDADELEVQDKAKEKRADKVARFDSTAQPTSPVRPAALQAARTPASAPQPKSNVLGDAPTSVPSATSAPHDGRHRPDTYKVARALDEMRERAAAAAAKQKAAAAAAAATTTATTSKPGEAARAVPTATSTGTGFLRGLGNLGAGFLGLGSSEADEARLRREEEDRRAQEEAEAELARIMRDMAEEDKKAAAEAAAAIALSATSSKPMTEVRKEAITVAKTNKPTILSDDEEDAANESISLPELPQPDIGDDFDAIPLDDGVTSALGAAGIDIDIDFPDSTTPPNSPPRRAVPVSGIPRSPAPAATLQKPKGKQALKVPEVVLSPPRAKTPAVPRAIRTKPSKASVSRPGTAASTYEDADDENDDELPTTMKKTPGMHRSRLLSNASAAGSTLGVSTKSSASTLLSQADRMAAKALGIKPTPGNVKSIQAAAAAKKKVQDQFLPQAQADKDKEQEQTDRKAELREKIEQRRLEEKHRKEAEEKAKLEEERKQRLAEEEDKRRRRAEADQRRKEREEKMERLAKEKAAREEREAATARAKQAEEEAARKRKMAPLIHKNLGSSSVKRPTAPAAAPPKKELASSKSISNLHAQSKMGPTSFRTNDEPTRAPTISLVVPPAPAAAQAERRPLGPPARTSTAQGPHGTHAAHAGPSNATVLQQSRAALQAQLDQKAIDMESEQIELPDIASEYSDSDDSEKEDDFKRPGWAGTPELRNALKAQASINPDDLFGPIRPLNMEELFNARQGKFRARTSSANWSGADRLTEQEEREYARRMGFRPINAPRESRPSGSNR